MFKLRRAWCPLDVWCIINETSNDKQKLRTTGWRVYSRGQSKSTNRLSGRELDVLTRFFSELSSKFRKTSKKAPPKFFPWVIRNCQIFGWKKKKAYIDSEIDNCIQNASSQFSKHCSTPSASILPTMLSSISGPSQSHAIGQYLAHPQYCRIEVDDIK